MTRPGEVLNTTRLVHRGSGTGTSWWRTSAVCDLPGAFGADDLTALHEQLEPVQKLGFDAVLLRLAEADVTRRTPDLKALVDSAHTHGLRVMVRVVAAPDDQVTAPTATPPLLELMDDADVLVERTRALLNAGVDGVDVGLIVDAPELGDGARRGEEFSRTVNQQLAELADLGSQTILSGEASRSHPDFFHRHLTEDWFHHLRDDSLYGSPWSARSLQNRIIQAYKDRDPLGHAAAWRPSLKTWAENPHLRGAIDGSWEEDAPAARSSAMITFSASLPGAIYLRYLTCGGSVHVSQLRRQRLSLLLGTAPLDMFQRGLASSVLHLRKKYDLGNATLAFVEGLSWANDQTSVHLSGPIMVVLNTSSRSITVPNHHSPLLYSGGFLDSTAEGTLVEPESCAWFVAGRPDPIDPADYSTAR